MLSREQYLDTLKYSNIISYIVGTYIQMNDLAAAQKEIDNIHAYIGIDNLPPDYAQIFYSSAGLVSMRLKDYPTALKYAHAACKLSENSSAPAIEYCKILGNISLMYAEAANYINKQFYLDAKWYIDEAISVFEDKVGSLTDHGAVGLTLLNNKAFVYDAIGDRNGAIETYEKMVSDFENNQDVKGSWLLAANNLAVLYLKTDNSKKAIALLESLSSKNKEYKQVLAQNLALAYYVSGDSKTKRALKDYNTICYNNCLDVFNFFTVAEREDYWTGIAREILILNNLVAEKYPEITDVAFDNLLFVKNLKLMSSDILKDIVENSSNSELKRKYNRIASLREAISYRSREQDSIRIWSNQLKEEERSILSMVPDYKERLLNAFHSWTDIRDALNDDEIAIDFSYVPKMKGWDNADGFYGAFVLTKNSKAPHLVSLCEVDSINKYFTGTISDAMQISQFYKDSYPIYKKLWGNLEDYFKGKKTIYFSPAGQLNLLNHNALVMSDGQLFGNCFNLVRLSSTDKILSQKPKESDGKRYQSAVVYGGIMYDLTVADMQEAAKRYSHLSDDHFLLAMRSEDERGHWNYLPGTKTESQNIFSLLTSNNISSTLLQEKEANEESFKSLSGHSPQIIHLSTHGFFLDTTDKVKKNPFMNNIGSYSEKEDKLIRTGVLLAGANNVWCGKNQVVGIEDGILTADEISRLDLSGTKLVVLSACETAKGQVDEIDGVLGLQRGLKKAGVGSILMSLWKVSDVVTSILMTQFYENIGKGQNSRESLKNAAQKVKEQYPDPYYWASFVLLD
jgi:tetratricopeptide (TPR) repeat protein